jgi:hypothetical protein
MCIKLFPDTNGLYDYTHFKGLKVPICAYIEKFQSSFFAYNRITPTLRKATSYTQTFLKTYNRITPTLSKANPAYKIKLYKIECII